MIAFRPLYPRELDAWYTHCHSVFLRDRPGFFRDHFVMDPEADCSLIFVAVDGEEIVSTVRVFRRTAWLQGRALPMGGVGEVSTKPAYRRQGLAGALLSMAIDAMASRGMALSLLFGDEPGYLRAGYRFCAAPLKTLEVSSLPGLGAGAAIRPMAMADLPLAMGMYDLYAGRLNGAVLRGEAYWRRWVLPQWTPPDVLVLENGPAGYCIARPQGKVLQVDELCVAPQGEPHLAGFLGSLARARGCGAVRAYEALVADLPGELSGDSRAMMARLITPLPGVPDSDALAALMSRAAGMFEADRF